MPHGKRFKLDKPPLHVLFGPNPQVEKGFPETSSSVAGSKSQKWGHMCSPLITPGVEILFQSEWISCASSGTLIKYTTCADLIFSFLSGELIHNIRCIRAYKTLQSKAGAISRNYGWNNPLLSLQNELLGIVEEFAFYLGASTFRNL